MNVLIPNINTRVCYRAEYKHQSHSKDNIRMAQNALNYRQLQEKNSFEREPLNAVQQIGQFLPNINRQIGRLKLNYFLRLTDGTLGYTPCCRTGCLEY